MLVLELTSPMAAIIAGLADLPMTESKVNSAPNFTTFGLEEIVEFTVVGEGPVLTATSEGIHKQKIKRNNVLPITMLPRGSILRGQKSLKNMQFSAPVLQLIISIRTGELSIKCQTISGAAQI